MILKKGNMWDVFGEVDVFFITTNPIVRKDGAAVMGRGIAKEAATRFPKMPYDLAARHADRSAQAEHYLTYPGNVGVMGVYDEQIVGWFMVKNHWREPAVLEIIKQSVSELSKLANRQSYWRMALNFPGIGNGKLKREDVLPIIERLPDNVQVWEYGQ